MLVHRLEVRNWRAFTRDVTVELGPGLNIITGPNESGKTSLYEALHAAFFQRADTTRREVLGVIPKGRQLHPYVAVELEVDGTRYRIEKTFTAHRQHTLLCRQEGSRWEPLAEDRNAEARLGELLAQDGFIQYGPALWAEQGRVTEILERGILGDLKARLAQLLTGLLLTQDDRQIEAWVRDEWEQRFTPERRRPKKQSPLDRALSDLKRVDDEVARARVSWQAHEEKLQQLKLTSGELGALQQQQQRQRAELEEARRLKTAWDEYRRLAAEAKAADIRAETLAAWRKRWADLIDELDKLEASLGVARDAAGRAEQDLQQAQAAHQQAADTVDSLTRLQGELDTQLRLVRVLQARSLARYLRHLCDSEPPAPDEEEMAELRDRMNKLRTLRVRFESLALRVRLEPSVRVAGTVSLDGQAPHQLDAAPGNVYTWKATQSAALNLDGIASISVETGMEDASGLQRQIEAVERDLDERLATWLIPDAAEQVAPAGEVAEQVAQVCEVAEHLAPGPEEERGRTTAKDSLEKLWNLLQQRFDEAERVRQEYARLEAVYEATYPDLPRERVESELEALLDQHPWARDLVKAERWLYKTEDELRALQAALEDQQATVRQRLLEARSEEQTASQRVAETQRAYDAAKSQLESFGKDRARRLSDLRQIKEEIRQREPGLAVYTAPDWDGQAPFDPARERHCELFTKLTEVASQASEHRAKLARDAEDRRPAGEEVSDARIRVLEADLQATGERLEQKKASFYTLEAQVKLAADGLSELLHSLEERYEDQLRTAQELALDAQAWDLLELTLQQEKGELTRSVLEPVERCIQPLLERLTRGRYRAVSVSDDNLTPRTLTGAHGEFEVGTGELSYGTEEQLALVTRLALGDLLVGRGPSPEGNAATRASQGVHLANGGASPTGEGGSSEEPHRPPAEHGRTQVLVMDDPLVHTDPARLNVAWQILLEAASRLQLVIFTCHPVPEEVAQRARFIRLERES